MKVRRVAVVVADLGFGDSGKGTMTDWLVRHYGARMVVRYNGGAQAGHTVVDGGRRHTFAQFGAGTLVEGVETHLGPPMIVHPAGLLREASVLADLGIGDALERLSIDPRARLITPFLQATGRLREVLRGAHRHGSCGLGVGETVQDGLEFPEDGLRAADLFDPATLRAKLIRQQNRKWAEFASRRREILTTPEGAREMAVLESATVGEEWMAMAVSLTRRVRIQPLDLKGGSLIFEGAQGVLLDEWRGFHPHTTWSTCTFDNALEMLRDWQDPILRLGVIRSYATRHGAGPFPTEDPNLRFEEPDNHTGVWQGPFRLGWLDAVLTRYAIECCGQVDGLAVTHLDRLPTCPRWKLATAYEECDRLPLGPFQDLSYQEGLTGLLQRANPVYREVAGSRLLATLEAQLGVPVWVGSYGPEAGHKRPLISLLA